MGKHAKYRSLVGAFALLLAVWPTVGQALCRQALALGHDVSGSVDAQEYDLQMNGLARALLSDEVSGAFLAIPDVPVRLMVYEWSGTGVQTTIVPWTDIRSKADLADVVEILTKPERRPRIASTAVGDAILYGALALADQTECWRRTLDISADGKSNVGPHPSALRLVPMLQGITINALIVASKARNRPPEWSDSEPALRQYFTQNVVRGADAFVQSAYGYADYARAIKLKLLKELETRAIGHMSPKPDKARG